MLNINDNHWITTSSCRHFASFRIGRCIRFMWESQARGVSRKKKHDSTELCRAKRLQYFHSKAWKGYNSGGSSLYLQDLTKQRRVGAVQQLQFMVPPLLCHCRTKLWAPLQKSRIVKTAQIKYCFAWNCLKRLKKLLTFHIDSAEAGMAVCVNPCQKYLGTMLYNTIDRYCW